MKLRPKTFREVTSPVDGSVMQQSSPVAKRHRWKERGKFPSLRAFTATQRDREPQPMPEKRGASRPKKARSCHGTVTHRPKRRSVYVGTNGHA
jgi:hypothetical protein